MEPISYPLSHLLTRGLLIVAILAVVVLALFAGIAAIEPVIQG